MKVACTTVINYKAINKNDLFHCFKLVLNTNKTEIERARKIKQVNEERQQHISSLTHEVKELKKDMSQIKDLLFRLVEDNHE